MLEIIDGPLPVRCKTQPLRLARHIVGQLTWLASERAGETDDEQLLIGVRPVSRDYGINSYVEASSSMLGHALVLSPGLIPDPDYVIKGLFFAVNRNPDTPCKVVQEPRLVGLHNVNHPDFEGLDGEALDIMRQFDDDELSLIKALLKKTIRAYARGHGGVDGYVDYALQETNLDTLSAFFPSPQCNTEPIELVPVGLTLPPH